ncbi:hypothetical protein [Priestia abyssalis]|uniref:hypothetical protein n=1 Tax=Priestia abyssalis TaxID=1221450 RepID=UPI00099529D4|nr:hypothetical protein [Priestia abyssalis]
MKKMLLLCLVMIFIINSHIIQVSAYSYGDPSEETVAEAYKEMAAKLNESPPNFAGAKAVFETVQEELDMHMGTEPSETILKDIENEDGEAVIQDMQKVLVLNIARRLESIEKKFEEYSTSKLLLAKAFATYEALSPVVQDNNVDSEIRAEFDKALESIGNPGLFGVGQKEANIDAFKESKENILGSLQKQFKLPSLEVGHFTEGESVESTGKKEWTDLSDFKNWIPIIIIVIVIAAIVGYSIAKKRK